MSFSDKIKEFNRKKESIKPDKEAVKVQHQKGKLTAEERLDLLLDKGSFIELGAFTELHETNFGLGEKKKPRDGVITGYGTINQKPVYVYAQDFTFMGGSMGEMHTRKIAKLIDLALKNGDPIIGLLDSGGARIQEGIHGLDGGGEIFFKNTQASGVVPQISAIMGPCAGIAVYSPALMDFIFMVNKTSNMFITGPDVIKAVTGEQVDFETLGGASAHNSKSGVAHFMAGDEKECLAMIRKLLSYLPQNNLDNQPFLNTGDDPMRFNHTLKDIVPADPKRSYDVKGVLYEVLDKKSFFEVHEHYAQNIVVGLGRLDGMAVGIVANQPKILAGCLDANSSDKIARFVRFCDAFNIPLINFVDVTGYLPGVDQEHSGVIRHGAKVLYAYSEATVPKISLVMRKAYGGAYIALVSKDMGYDKVIAWPTAEIAVMGPEQAVNIIFRKEIQQHRDSKAISSSRNAKHFPESEKIRKEKIKEYTEKFLNPYVAASCGKVDLIIDPKETRKTLVKCMEMLANKRQKGWPKKHGNMPM